MILLDSDAMIGSDATPGVFVDDPPLFQQVTNQTGVLHIDIKSV